MSNPNTNTNTTRTANDGPESYIFYTPPTTPDGDRDIRKEVEIWRSKRVANRSIENYPLDALILIDSLVAAIDEERVKRKDAEEQAERWEDDALRLMQERNDAMKERDEARFEQSGSDELVRDLENLAKHMETNCREMQRQRDIYQSAVVDALAILRGENTPPRAA